MPELEQVLQEKLNSLKENNLLRTINNSDRSQGVYIERNGKKLISFCCNDYFGLAQNEYVIEAAISAAWQYGAGAGASRLITGNHPLYGILEKKLATIKNTEDCCIFGSGYLANIGIIPALVGKGDLIIADRLVHSCVYSGVKLSGAEYKRYAHNDLENLSNVLQKNRNKYSNCLIITETIFSMDGDKADINAISKIAKEFDCWLMTDDAHGFGMIESESKADIQMGTLSKGLGSYGGYVCASKIIIDYIKTSAKSLMYSTALPPSVIGAAIASLELIEENPDICKQPLEKARIFADIVGLKKPESAIVPLIIGGEDEVLKVFAQLEGEGFLVAAIRPPTVPKDTARLRFTFSVLHKDEDVRRLAEIVRGNFSPLSEGEEITD